MSVASGEHILRLLEKKVLKKYVNLRRGSDKRIEKIT
jgi:hypothetical protein